MPEQDPTQPPIGDKCKGRIELAVIPDPPVAGNEVWVQAVLLLEQRCDNKETKFKFLYRINSEEAIEIDWQDIPLIDIPTTEEHVGEILFVNAEATCQSCGWEARKRHSSWLLIGEE